MAVASLRMIPSNLLHQLGLRFCRLAIAAFIVAGWFGCSSTQKQSVGSVEIMGALNRFQAGCGRFPTTAEGLPALVKDPGVAGWKGPYWEGGFGDRWGTAWTYENKDWPTIRSAGGKLTVQQTRMH